MKVILQTRSIFIQMKLFKVAGFNSKELWSHFKTNKNYLETCWKNPEILSVWESGNPEGFFKLELVNANNCKQKIGFSMNPLEATSLSL